jgi:predicted nicotinamide N-methyase
LNPRAVENIEHNISLNTLVGTKALRMDWNDTRTWPQDQVDYIIGSDLVYQKSLVPLLAGVLLKLVRPGGTFFYVAPKSGRDGLNEFIKEMKKICTGWEEEEAADELISNPLTNQDDEECFVHFQELSTLTFVLYTFPFPKGP